MTDFVFRNKGEVIPVILPVTHCLIWLCEEPIERDGYCRGHISEAPARRVDKGPCSVPGCERPVRAKGLCNTHGDKRKGACSVCGKPNHARGLCKDHYNDQYREQRRRRAA